jgi:large subunit ribosomal protein L17
MRHGRKINHLGRTSSHRKAMLANMACSLIEHKKINTTVAKAKALRTYIEPLITKSKNDSTHSRRTVYSYLKSKEAVAALFRDVAVKVATRPGGYTRILKTGNRLGDNAEMCFIELVDFNEFLTGDSGKSAAPAKKATRRSRGGATKKTVADADATIVEETKGAEEAKPKKPRAKKAKDSDDKE